MKTSDWNSTKMMYLLTSSVTFVSNRSPVGRTLFIHVSTFKRIGNGIYSIHYEFPKFVIKFVCRRSKDALSLLCGVINEETDVQSNFNRHVQVVDPISETLPETQQQNDAKLGKEITSEKKSRFTLEYLENKICRPLEEKEVDHLQKLINKGEDRGIFAFLFGSGTNQSWPCQLCSLVIKGTMKEVSKHYLNEHQASPLFPCQLCGKVIKSMHTYKRHRTAHLSEYKCPSCDKVFQVKII